MKEIAIVKYVFTLAGIGALVCAFLFYKSTSSFIAESTKTEGTVVDVVRSQSSEGSTIYKPVVHFIDQNGQKIKFTSSTGSNESCGLIGQKVEVLYRPTDPHNAEINSFFNLWGFSAIFGGLGGVFLLFGLIAKSKGSGSN